MPFERVAVPYRGKTLHGMFFAARQGLGPRWPAVYRTGGADSVKESSFFTSIWSSFVDRNVSCLLMDAPGQGEALNMDDLPLPAAFETVVTAAVDYLVKRPDVDPARIGIYGTSMGGYFAGRGATAEKLPAAYVLQSAWYDVLHDSYEYCPSMRPHLRYMIAAGSDAQARQMLETFSFSGIAARITTPITIAHGERDDVVRVEGARRLFGEIASADKSLTIVPGARHSLDTEVRRLVDWMCLHLRGTH
jgi:alpha-beta hydrolase superfamily lysophospholipase